MKKAFVAAVLVLGVALAACGQAPAPETPVQRTPAQMSEEELRQALAAADGDEALVYYEELRARDLLVETDHQELLALYTQRGDTESQRATLLRLLRLYPDRDYAQQLAAMVAERDAGGTCGELLAQAAQALAAEDALTLQALVTGTAWNTAFQDDLRAVEIRSRCRTDDALWQITAGVQSDSFTCLCDDGTCWYFRTDNSGTVLASAVYTDGAYNGAVKTAWYDAAGQQQIAYAGTLAENLCTDTLTVTYGGVTYTGKLNSDGTTAEKQENAVTRAGGVLYARSGNRYLYKADAAVADFHMDCIFLGLPLYTPWEENAA